VIANTVTNSSEKNFRDERFCTHESVVANNSQTLPLPLPPECGRDSREKKKWRRYTRIRWPRDRYEVVGGGDDGVGVGTRVTERVGVLRRRVSFETDTTTRRTASVAAPRPLLPPPPPPRFPLAPAPSSVGRRHP
jgi:hypothetical protein